MFFFPNFSDLSAKLGRVQAAEHNLKIKTICVYLTLITLYFSGIGASEFKQIVEKRLDEERNRISTPSQTWLIPHPKSSSWGDLKDYNKVSLVKNIIGYTPRITTKGDERNMIIYLERLSKFELAIPKEGTNKRYLLMGAPILDFLAVEAEGLAGWKYPSLKSLKTYQNNKGLTFSVLKEVEVREIICGESTHKEIEKFHEWTTSMHCKNQDEFDTGASDINGRGRCQSFLL